MATSFSIKRPSQFEGSAIPSFLIGAFVSFGGILYGYDTGTMGGILVMPYWRDLFSNGYINPDDNKPDVTTSQTSLVVSILSVGTFFGALLAAPLADKVGRRWAMLLSASIVFNLGVILQTVATALPMFVAGRVFAGLGVGLISTIVPLYQSETAPAWIRGAIVGIYQFSLVLGQFIAVLVDNATKDRNDSGSYRIPIAVQFSWSLVVTFGVLFLPESPRYLIKCGHLEKATKSLARLRWLDVNNPSLKNELDEIQANHEYDISSGKASYLDTWRGTLGKRTFTGCAVQALQQLAGINFILYYGTRFFNASGISDPFLTSVITSVVLVGTTIPGLYLIEVLGRRKLLMIGGIGMAVSHFVVAAVGAVIPDSTTGSHVLIVFVCFFLCFFACSWGPGAWVVSGELFPLRVRAKCLSQATASNWLFNWALGYATPYLVDQGPGKAGLQAKVFFVWGGFCVIGSVFVYYFVYETRGLTLEQVDEMYGQISKAWESPKFVSTLSFRDVQQGDVHGVDKSVGEKDQHKALHIENPSVDQK